jgi:hypothetical protein
MIFDDLLDARLIERAAVTPAEIADLLEVARRDIRTAQILVSTDLDWAFAVAYNAILQSSVAYMYHLGFRPRGEGKHFNTFRFIEQALPDQSVLARRLQKLRRKRNATVYEQVGAISEKEAREIIAFAVEYCEHIVDLLPTDITTPRGRNQEP